MMTNKHNEDEKREKQLLEFLAVLNSQTRSKQMIDAQDVMTRTGESLSVEFGGKEVMALNASMVQSRKLTAEQISRIKTLHVMRFTNIDAMSKLDPIKENESLRKLAKVNTDIEFDLQDAWGFTRDASFHYWYELPHCTCPKMDNRERSGTTMQIVACDCPIHSTTK